MKRGDVWWAELAGEAGFRPVVIVSRADSIDSRYSVTIAEITRTIRTIPSEVPLSRKQGMPADCVINTDNLHTIPKHRLRRQMISLTDEQQFALARALQYSLDTGW